MEYLPGKEAQAEREEFIRQALCKVYNECPGVTSPVVTWSPDNRFSFYLGEHEHFARLLAQAEDIVLSQTGDTRPEMVAALKRLTPEQKQVLVHKYLPYFIQWGISEGDKLRFEHPPYKIDLLDVETVILAYSLTHQHWHNLLKQHEEFKKFVEQQPHAALVKRAIKKYIENG